MDRVVCIKDDWPLSWRAIVPNLPVCGRIYTIRQAMKDPIYGATYFLFEELVNPPVDHPTITCRSGEPNFLETYFRPVRKTNIDDLVALQNTKVLEDVS